jgi:hypothetical protein
VKVQQVAIFQEEKHINEYFESKGIDRNNIMEVGPFPSRLEAVEWINFLETKGNGGEFKRHAVGYMNKQPWYGCIVA